MLHVDLRTSQGIDFELDSNHTTRFSYLNQTVHQFLSEFSSKAEYLFGEDFIGCLGKIDLGDKSFVLTSSTSEFTITIDSSSSIQKGCIASDVCAAKPCQNNALNYCVDLWKTFECVSPGKCEKPSRCHNNGQCVPAGSASFTCDCSRVQFGGDLCDVPLVCLDSPCSGNKVCTTKGVTYECVSLDTALTDSDDLLIIVIPIVCVVFVLAVIIGCLSSKRRWKEKAFRDEVFKGGFEDESVSHGNEIKLCEYKNHAYDDDDGDMYTTKQHKHLNRDRRTRRRNGEAMEDPSLSLPELRERPFAILKKKYRSEEYFHGMSTSTDVNYNDTTCPPQQPTFDSSYSDDDDFESVSNISYVSTVQPEMYDMERVSMQFSEMSFQQDQPISKEIERLRHHHNGGRECYRNRGYVSESSEAYFTSSEFDYKMSLKKGIRRPPAYVLSENKHIHRTIDQASETSSNLSRSNLNSMNSENDLRQSLKSKNISSRTNKKNNNNNDDVASEMTSFHNDHKKVLADSEAEEFV